MIFESCENHQNKFQKYTKSDHVSLTNRRKTVSEKQAKKTYLLDRFLLHFGVHFGQKNIKKGLKNRSLARGVSGGAPGLIFDRLLIIFWKRVDVLLELFSSYFEEASGCTFRSFCFYRLRLFCCVCLCLLCVCVCVCVVSCRVVSSCVVSCRVVFFYFFVNFQIVGEKTFFDCCRRDTSTNERDCPASQSTVAGLARQRLWIFSMTLSQSK